MPGTAADADAKLPTAIESMASSLQAASLSLEK